MRSPCPGRWKLSIPCGGEARRKARGLFTGVRGRVVLGTSLLGGSRKSGLVGAACTLYAILRCGVSGGDLSSHGFDHSKRGTPGLWSASRSGRGRRPTPRSNGSWARGCSGGGPPTCGRGAGGGGG